MYVTLISKLVSALFLVQLLVPLAERLFHYLSDFNDQPQKLYYITLKLLD